MQRQDNKRLRAHTRVRASNRYGYKERSEKIKETETGSSSRVLSGGVHGYINNRRDNRSQPPSDPTKDRDLGASRSMDMLLLPLQLNFPRGRVPQDGCGRYNNGHRGTCHVLSPIKMDTYQRNTWMSVGAAKPHQQPPPEISSSGSFCRSVKC